MTEQDLKNKELVEQTYEDKSNFLFEMTGEVRNPLFNIGNICNNIKELNDIDEINQYINVAKNLSLANLAL